MSQQTAEMQQIHQTVYELDLAHRKMKESYEEEIVRLKRELEARGGPLAQQQRHAVAVQQQQQQLQQQQPQHQQQPQGPPPQPQQQPQQLSQPPSLGHSSTNVFGGIMSGQAGPTSLEPPQAQPQQPGYPNSTAYNGYSSGSGGIMQQPQQPQQQQAAQPQPQQPPTASQVQQGAQPAAQPAASQTPQPQSGSATVGSSAVSPRSKKRQPEAATAPPTSTAAIMNGPNSMTKPLDNMNSSTATAVSLGNNLGDLDIDKVPNELKKQKDDWFVIYNERAPRLLDVDMVQSLEHHSVVCCVRFSFDGKYIATGCNRSAQIFDVQTGQLICRLQDDSVDRDGDLYIRSVCFSPDGKYLATGAEDKQIRVWDIKARTIRYLFSGHEQDIYSLDFSRNGRHIASGSGDRTVRMWDMESGQCILTLSIEDGVTTVAISPDGRYVAAGSLDKTVRVWDTTTGFLVERLEAPDGHKDSVYSVAFSPNGRDLVSGSLDKTIKLWELQAPRGIQSTHKGGVCVKTFVGHKDFVLSVASTPDSQWILSGSKDRGVQFWDPNTSQVQLMLQGHKNSVISVAPSPTGGLFATGSGDCRARIWKYYPVSR